MAALLDELGAEPRYAVVVMHTALRRAVTAPTEPGPDDDEDDPDHLARAFTYAIPPALLGVVRPGQLVWAPFGARILQGIVVALDTSSPVAETKDLGAIVDPEPLLSPMQIELARWIGAYYLTPLHRVMWAMLPPGITQQVETHVSLAPGAPIQGRSPAQTRLLVLLAERGELSLPQVVQRLGREGRSAVDSAAMRGWVTKRMVLRPPRVRPKLAPVLRPSATALAGARPGERASQQRLVLDFLLAHAGDGDGWLLRERVLREGGASAAVLDALQRAGLVEEAAREVWRDPLAGQSFAPATPPPLTSAQEVAWQAIAADLDRPAGRPFLLHGVTGSGKTELYLRAAARVLQQGRGAIVLVPEIALTPQTIRRFGARFPTTLAVAHGQLKAGERYDQWRRVRSGELRLVIGSRLALFSPVRDLGLIVLDEEHEGSYKQDETPHYHAREAATRLAALSDATLILGSATPSLESAYRAERGEYRRIELPQRVLGHRAVTAAQSVAEALAEAPYADLPPVEVVDLRAELRAGNTSIFSRALRAALDATLAANEQAILFLNRRGSATFVLCRDCGLVLRCARCEVPLTVHEDEGRLVCHHCGQRTAMPQRCPQCGGQRIRQFGVGTERVEELVRQIYPAARTVRWDADTVVGGVTHEQLLDRFVHGEADILIGTQMIAKGLDLPRVTLVGVITADTMLNLPDLRAGERTFQLLTQVAGRAGRSALGGKVIVQTYAPEHPAIQAASRHDYDAFYRSEMAFRREHWYPPLSRLVRLVLTQGSARLVREQAEQMRQVLEARLHRLALPELDLIGPAPCFFARERSKWRWQLLVRGREPQELLRDVHLPLGWRVDVDPESLL